MEKAERGNLLAAARTEVVHPRQEIDKRTFEKLAWKYAARAIACWELHVKDNSPERLVDVEHFHEKAKQFAALAGHEVFLGIRRWVHSYIPPKRGREAGT